MGIKWQCVEYARRWLYQNKNLSFNEVDYAYEIWTKINFYFDPDQDKKIPTANYLNKASRAPRVGDLLIYAKQFLQTGHVAVITEVDLEKKIVQVAEQNYNNQMWTKNYSREIVINITGLKTPNYELKEDYLLGWQSID